MKKYIDSIDDLPDDDGPELPAPRQYALVRLVDWFKEQLVEHESKDSPLLAEDVFVYLGEIPNMPGHCVVAGHHTGRIVSGFHIDDFEEVPSDEA
jgi:hypothetical protein